jgi:predicted membrane protein
VVLFFGVLFTLDNLSVIELDGLWRFGWIALLVLGLYLTFSRPASAGRRVLGVVLIVFGGVKVLQNFAGADISIGDLWPLILVAIGASMIWRHRGGWRRRFQTDSSGPNVDVSAIFGGGQYRISSREFRGGEVNAIFGGCEIDFRGAELAGSEATLDVFALFGGIDIWVPESWRVLVQGVPVLGGFSDETRPPAGPPGQPEKRLIVKGTAIFGGIEVKN